MPKPTPQYRSESVVLAEIELRRRALAYQAVVKLPLEDERWQDAWRELLAAATAIHAPRQALRRRMRTAHRHHRAVAGGARRARA